MMQICFRSTENQACWAWTHGLRILGQREIAVIIPWSEQDLRTMFITRLLRFLENYLISQPKRILPEQTLHYGWTTLRFVEDEHNLSGAGADVLLIEEMQHPFFADDSSYIPGVERMVALMQLQDEAMQRNSVTGDVIYPHRSQYALVCTRVTPGTVHVLRPLMVHRPWQPNVQESGWFIGCCNQDHDHDHPDELNAIHLYHLVSQFPGIFPYLAMPVNTALLFEKDQVILFRPGEQNGQVDPGNLLTSLP